MARQLEKNPNDSVTKATKQSYQKGIHTVGCYRKVKIWKESTMFTTKYCQLSLTAQVQCTIDGV